jgi:hypothetical protein
MFVYSNLDANIFVRSREVDNVHYIASHCIMSLDAEQPAHIDIQDGVYEEY